MSKAWGEVPAGEGLGLLGRIDPIDSEVSKLRERIKALSIRMSLDQRERALNRNPFFGNFRLFNEISFERRLLDFAARNGITLLDPTDWRLPALMVAAKEHRELVPPVKRGRPAALGGVGLLGDPLDKKRAHKDAASYSAMVRDIMKIECISQRQACHRLAAELFPTYSGLSLDSKAKQIENHVSAHNTKRGERRKPGRAKRAG
ncbi:hypothetical protein B5K08_22365 [Rhizobium leguminosarum bv. trifolii]|uniref:Uncharacterized protein n=1 Tax=Rhizobium leguminosarum bv. trifolii TaxID=386 RepID=A0A3E1B824_RHILT|nr:hypothetical protein [Rhizobium leguminosarum]RFB87195.1 hypothetical protein B5K08_22365 [Rhizobium leguminosarum bv. trifolii]RFB87376.1 hypothetical protein B5K10_22355 [Rhizobium leguminosarum bv. trifolii]